MKKSNIAETILVIVIVIFFFIAFILSPVVTAIGVATGKLDIETLEPKEPVFESVQDKIRSETMIQ